MRLELRELSTSYASLAKRLGQWAEQLPEAYVVRNSVGNLAILAADGTYIGWIDVLTGEVHLTT